MLILMRTTHRLFFKPAQDMSAIADASVNEIITSPPFPMIEMWDGILASQKATFGEALYHGSVDVAGLGVFRGGCRLGSVCWGCCGRGRGLGG